MGNPYDKILTTIHLDGGMHDEADHQHLIEHENREHNHGHGKHGKHSEDVEM